jgi:hypothetical protein
MERNPKPERPFGEMQWMHDTKLGAGADYAQEIMIVKTTLAISGMALVFLANGVSGEDWGPFVGLAFDTRTTPSFGSKAMRRTRFGTVRKRSFDGRILGASTTMAGR